jgi:Protein of unknown function (DUF2950)
MKNILTAFAAITLVLATPSFAQERFDSAEAAAQAVIGSAEKHDAARLTAIFGPQGSAILTSGTPSQDQSEQTEFAKLARAKHQLHPDARNPNRMLLAIGDEDWPFPVPIVLSKGKWSFDASETKMEMQARRIGTHELDAIEICAGFVDAQKKYAAEDHDKDGVLKYATHMTAGANGLDVPSGLVDATWEGQKPSTKPYHGYYFRILDQQGPHAPGGAHNYLVKNTDGRFRIGCLARAIRSDGNLHVHGESGWCDLSKGHRLSARRRARADHAVRPGSLVDARGLNSTH